MEIFVRSSGYSQDCGYRWLPDEPPQWNNVSKLIQSESPSVVLTRFDKQLSLFVTGLESLEKKDFRDRPIRHSIAWICHDNDYGEEQIRTIAVQALRELLSSQVDKHISFGGKNGFEVSFPELKEMSQSLSSLEIEKLDSSEKDPQIGKKSEGLLNKLALELQQYRLPKEYKFLVVVTGVKSEKSLEKERIWRSLSNLVKSEEWKKLSESEEKPPNFLRATIAIVVVIVVIAALILLLILLHPFAQKPEVIPSPTPTATPTNQAISASQTQQKSSIKSPDLLKEELAP